MYKLFRTLTMQASEESIESSSGRKANAEMLQDLAKVDGKFLSPIDLTMNSIKPLNLPKLFWQNFSLQPTRMKVTNTGHTVILSGKWSQQRPHITGGPLLTNYVFSQIHFHWGLNEREGSEHITNGIAYPMEMHVVFFKSAYLTQEAALKEDDGIVVLTYFFRIIASPNSSLEIVTSGLSEIKEARNSVHVQAIPLSLFLEEFTDDYLVYWGGIQTLNCMHTILWIISRLAMGVSTEQLAAFRELKDTKGMKLTRNFRDPHPLNTRSVFHINPSSDTSQLLLPGVIQATSHGTSPVLVKTFTADN